MRMLMRCAASMAVVARTRCSPLPISRVCCVSLRSPRRRPLCRFTPSRYCSAPPVGRRQNQTTTTHVNGLALVGATWPPDKEVPGRARRKRRGGPGRSRGAVRETLPEGGELRPATRAHLRQAIARRQRRGGWSAYATLRPPLPRPGPSRASQGNIRLATQVHTPAATKTVAAGVGISV